MSAKKSGGKAKVQSKSKDALVKEANKRLSQNPKDIDALNTIADAQFSEEQFDKAYKTYELLLSMVPSHPELDEFLINMRYGISALKLKHFDTAYKSLVFARTLKGDVFEVNSNLGFLEYKKKSYEKAVGYLTAALQDVPDHLNSLKYMGISLFKMRKHKQALEMLKKLIDQRPDDKEALFTLGECYFELGQIDRAISIFSHLRADPIHGPQAALMAGSLNYKAKRYENAQLDFEIGLKHQNIRKDILLELKYRLAAALLKMQDPTSATVHLKDINAMDPTYKDVAAQLSRSAELSKSEHLKTYLMAPASEFVSLCRRLSEVFFKNSRTKILDISVHKEEYTDILAEVETVSWSDIILYRYIRSTGQVGELMLRDFHGRLKDVKAGRGFCVCAGTFSETAIKFVEARFIDLVDKEQLTKSFNKLR